MKTIAVSYLRANLMKVLKSIESGVTIIITSHGKEIAKLVPPSYSQKEAKYKLAELSQTAQINDILTPLGEEWDADQ